MSIRPREDMWKYEVYESKYLQYIVYKDYAFYQALENMEEKTQI